MRKANLYLAAIVLLAFCGVVKSQATVFTYRGKLTDAGNPANASLRFPVCALSAGVFTESARFPVRTASSRSA